MKLSKERIEELENEVKEKHYLNIRAKLSSEKEYTTSKLMLSIANNEEEYKAMIIGGYLVFLKMVLEK